MRRLGILTIMAVIGSAALAHSDVTVPSVQARMDGMMAMSKSIKELVGMSRGQVPFDADRAAELTELIATEAKAIPDRFADQAMDPKSEARAEIWQDWERFTALSHELAAAAAGLQLSDKSAVPAAMQQVGGYCRDCHEQFRE